MIDDVGDIASYYNNNPEREHLRLEQHRLEYELTWRYFERYLPPQGSILEVGAATGRYTLELARRGYSITAVDMSAVLLDQCAKRISEEGLGERVHFVLADARDLSQLAPQSFDAVLLMGPLYHLVVKADRQLAINQAFTLLKDKGLLFSSFISRFGIFGDLMGDHPEWIENQAEVRSILEAGKDPGLLPHAGFRGYFARADEVAPLHEELGFETLVVAGVEPSIAGEDESYNRLMETWRLQWLDLLFEISTEPSILGASRHLLYIGRKLSRQG